MSNRIVSPSELAMALNRLAEMNSIYAKLISEKAQRMFGEVFGEVLGEVPTNVPTRGPALIEALINERSRLLEARRSELRRGAQ